MDQYLVKYRTPHQIRAFDEAIRYALLYAEQTGVKFRVTKRKDGGWRVQATKEYTKPGLNRGRFAVRSPQVRSGPFR